MRLYARTLVFVVAIAIGTAALCRGDVFHLKNGGSVEGALVEQDAENYMVRTTVGIATLPINSVDRIEKKPTILDEYEQRRGQMEDTVAAHLALAQWCAEQDYTAGWRTHLKAALRLDPDCAPAREALGYVQVDGKWVKKSRLEKAAATQPADSAASQPSGAASEKAAEKASEKSSDNAEDADDLEQPEDQNSELVRAIQGQWYRQIRAIREQKLESANPRRVQEGRDKIMAIDDPLAVRPMVRALGEGGAAARGVLLEALSRFSNDEATVNIAVLAIVDPEETIRHDALVELKRRDDPRVSLQFRKGLYSKNDELVRRAAIGIGVLRDKSAVPDLIELLTAQRTKLVEISTRAFFREMFGVFTSRYNYTTGSGQTIGYFPTVEVNSPGFHNVIVDRDYQYRHVTVYRTEVLEALRGITGQNFGFDAADWRRWYEEQQP